MNISDDDIDRKKYSQSLPPMSRSLYPSSPSLSNPNFVKKMLFRWSSSTLSTALNVSCYLWALAQYWVLFALHGTLRRLHEVEGPISYFYVCAVAVLMGGKLITILSCSIDLKWLAGKLSPIDKVSSYRKASDNVTFWKKLRIEEIVVSDLSSFFILCFIQWAIFEWISAVFICSLLRDHLISYSSSTGSAADKSSSSSKRGGDRARANPAANGGRDLEDGGTENGDLVGVGGRDPGDGGGGGRGGGRRDPAILAYQIALITFIITTVIAMLSLLASLRALGPNNFRDIINADSAIVVFGVLYMSGIIGWILWLLGAFL